MNLRVKKLRILCAVTLPFLLLFCTPGATQPEGPETGMAEKPKAGVPGILHVALEGDDQNPGTLARPMRTIQHAARSAKAGDTVLIREGFYRILLEQSLKLTKPRKAMIDLLLKKRGWHFQAEELLRELNAESPGVVSRATIYRTLDLLVTAEILAKTRIHENSYLYELVDSEGHGGVVVRDGDGGDGSVRVGALGPVVERV